MTKKRRGILASGLLLASVCLLVGCGSSSANLQSTVVIDNDGSIEQHILEPAGDTDYSGLKEFLEDDIAVYNLNAGTEAVVLDGCSVGGDKISVDLSYASCGDYCGYNQVPCYYGTIQEAYTLGYIGDISLKDAKGEHAALSDVLAASPDLHVLLLQEPVCVKTYSKIQYVSEQVTIKAKKEAVIEGVENSDDVFASNTLDTLACIIFK